MLKKIFGAIITLMVAACGGVTPPKPTPPPIPDRTVAISVTESDGTPIPTATILTSPDEDFPHVNADGYSKIQLSEGVKEFSLEVDAPHYGSVTQLVELPAGNVQLKVILFHDPDPMPHPPSKGELMRAQYTFQGLRASCPEYDSRPIPIFDPMLDVVDQDCQKAILDAHKAVGDKVIGVAISHRYAEPGLIPILQQGKDWTQNLPGLHDYLVSLIKQGFYIQLHLAGDGHSTPDRTYNDPVGWTYGCEWLNENFSRIADSLDDIHQYIRFLPGYDGIFYGCETPDGQPIEIPKFAKAFKARWPDGVLGIEFNVGHLPFGEGDADWQPGGRMSNFDMVFAEFDGNLDQDSTWQIIARLVGPAYNRPPQQSAGDDPNPPFYLRNWPGIPVCFEWATYDDVRFKLTPDQVQAQRQKLRNMGCPFTG